MKILFSPAESKREDLPGLPPFDPALLLCDSPLRHRCIALYNAIITDGERSELELLSGLKNPSLAPITGAPAMKAILRYDGVAYGHLDYPSLAESAQCYIDSHTLLFSNLLGPIRASDPIPNYKLKQGSTLRALKPEVHYKKELSGCVEAWLGDAEVLDLRAGFYERFYTLNHPHIALEFLKGGKVVSHWAKAYRGIVLRCMAEANVEGREAFMAMEIPGVKLREVRLQGVRETLVMEVV